jgi:uncharacterized alkaline shock family protein YloU
MRFGVELAAVASQIQHRVVEQIEKMTSKSVARVNVVIDGVRTDSEVREREDWGEQPHTD